MRKLNQRLVEQRGEEYQIGHSYFLPLKSIQNEEEKLDRLDDIWNYQVVPLLKEYFFGQVDLLRSVLPKYFAQIDDGQGPSIMNLLPQHGEDLIVALQELQA